MSRRKKEAPKTEVAQESPIPSPPVEQPASQPPSSVPPIPTPPPSEGAQSKAPTDKDLYQAMYESLDSPGTEDKHARRDEVFKKYLASIVGGHKIAADYNIIILYDDSRMVKADADRIYSSVSCLTDKKPILLVLYSSGGSIASAYLIGKLCREHSKDKFVVGVPRQAKSAATLLSCAADEIHMGSLSELGPIDPQIDGLPALGLKSSVEHLADLVRQHPAAAEMFARYLHLSLKPVHLGYYERVAVSAMQYAERLLNLHKGNLPGPAAKMARDLVYTYKDHGFVIDKGEAEKIFGPAILKSNTPEYELSNSIYQVLSSVSQFASMFDHSFYMIGSLTAKPQFFKKQR